MKGFHDYAKKKVEQFIALQETKWILKNLNPYQVTIGCWNVKPCIKERGEQLRILS